MTLKLSGLSYNVHFLSAYAWYIFVYSIQTFLLMEMEQLRKLDIYCSESKYQRRQAPNLHNLEHLERRFLISVVQYYFS